MIILAKQVIPVNNFVSKKQYGEKAKAKSQILSLNILEV
jgi:hypothetical protein